MQLTFRNVKPSAAVAARVQAEAKKLERFCQRIIRCRVVIEAPHRHHRRGETFQVRIDVAVPGGEIMIRHAPSFSHQAAQAEAGRWAKHLELGTPHKDMYLAVRDAFRAARRRLEDYARRLRGDVKQTGNTIAPGGVPEGQRPDP